MAYNSVQLSNIQCLLDWYSAMYRFFLTSTQYFLNWWLDVYYFVSNFYSIAKCLCSDQRVVEEEKIESA